MKRGYISSRGFTLIELLVVIAIIAILSVVVILTLNPAELLRQSRDSNRISDLSVTKSAIAFYLASVTTPSIGTSTCYMDATSANATNTCDGVSGIWFATQAATTTTSSLKIDGTGWIPVNFSSITAGGSPLASLPHDPTNSGGNYFYSYIASSGGYVFKLDAHMESSKYGSGGTNSVVSTDGGTDPNSYEVGTSLSL